MQVRAVLAPQPRLGRAGAEFSRAGRRAAAVAVLRLLPAHPRGRHLHRPAPAAAAARAPPAPALAGSRAEGGPAS